MTAFTLNKADLVFVLRQIEIAEAHSNGIALTEIRVNAVTGRVMTDPAWYTPANIAANPALAIPDPHVPAGLRTVDGTYNNIVEGRETWGAADQPMPHMLTPSYLQDTDGDTMSFGPPGPGVPDPVTNGDYSPGTGNIADADPRTISNLIVDMTLNNPAAIIAALTFAGSEDPNGDAQRIIAARVNQAEADAALADAQAALSDANAALDAAVAAYVPGNPSAIDAIQDAAVALSAAEAAFSHAQTVALNPAGAQVALAESLGLTIEDGSLVIPNVAPDEGLSAPFNAWMTFFGQFFDHGLDLIAKGGNGTIFVPLANDDPLVLGADGTFGTTDDLPAHLRFMAVTRSTPAGDSQLNTTTPFVDQNQTYTSHASHQVFLREYVLVDGKPMATGKLLGGAEGGLATWADVKEQAENVLGIVLSDADVLNVPLLRTDPYGEFIRSADGFPQVVTAMGVNGPTAWVSGTADIPLVLADIGGPNAGLYARTAHAFLDDIAHNAAPIVVGGVLQADTDGDTGNAVATNAQGQRLEYDDELLDRHYITGDGRGNENIGLTAVHHIFHSEHNRQVDSQKLTILQSGDLTFVNEWLTANAATDADTLAAFNAGFDAASDKAAYLAGSALFNGTGWDGERLFQAARFATEMQYQHLVFEEFARKIQPAIDPFVFNSVTDINPAIFAEFANTVYRFGHSMLTDGMPRLDANGNVIDADMGLIEAFLNPVAFDLDGTISHDAGAGAIVRGMVVERGNEIDEFVVEALRNNLLGLPLDLAAINIARGRDTGTPTLNDARTQLYEASGSTFLKPYDNWVDLAANLKNPASVINFIAAYGTHQTILDADTLAEKRAAATLLVMGDVDVDGDGIAEAAPVDRMEFLNGPAATTGVNAIDLWIGGLAEKKMPFGGMLGSTFNAIFEAQLENLQDGDRFYYLTRTQGQNFLNMLEQNSFAKLIMANTDIAQPGADGIRGTMDDEVARHLGVDVFADYDYVLEVNQANQADPDPIGNDPVLEAAGRGKVQRDDPTTPGVDTNFIRFAGGEHVVVGGTNQADTIITDFGDDGIWGDGGDDRIESGAGVDLVNGGAGNDVITDSGDTGDFIKGDEGDDVIANSNGIDILMGGKDNDVIFVGVDDTEVFGGEGNDFIAGGAGVDLLLGNEGDDWIEAGAGFDTTAGDNSELFFNSEIKGHDVMFAGSDEHDFDAESGDDIMVQGESVMRNEGMFGFDWAIFKGAEIAGYADMRIPIFTTEQADILRNRFDKTEALSGWKYNDTLIGDDRTFGTIAPGDTVATTEGVFFNDGLDQAGIDRIAGLSQIVSVGTTGFFESGNILLGGAGSDQLRGNGGDDILDGDRWLNVRIRLTEPGVENTPGNEIGTVDSLRHVFADDHPNAAWAGRSLFDLLIDRTIVPSQMHIVREVVTTGAEATDVDVAHFNDVRANYTITANPDGSVTITHDTVTVGAIDPLTGRNLISDGVDTLRNIEKARFADGVEVSLVAPKLALNGFDPVTETWADNFNTASYTNNTGGVGSQNFNSGWTETNDGVANANAGSVQVTGGSLTFLAGNADDAAVTRTLDLQGASSVTVTFSVADQNVGGFLSFDNEEIFFDFAADGTNFVNVQTFNGSNGGNQTITLPTNVPFSADAAIRFRANNTLDGGESFSIDNLSINATVLTPVVPPGVDHTISFTENGAAISIASLPDITDDDANIASARIVLTNAQAGDVLAVTGLGGTGITSNIVNAAGQIVLTLTGPASQAAFERAIQLVTYDNTSENPSAVARVIETTVNDGVNNSNVARTTVNVTPVNDAPNAVADSVVTNITGPVVVREWMMLRNDTDAEGDVLDVSNATENDANFTITFDGDDVTATRTDADNTKDFTYTLSDGTATDTADVDITWDTVGTVSGTNGADIVLGDGAGSTFDGNGGNDIIIAGAGNDTIDGDTGNDEIIWGVGDGRDFVNGGANTDTMVINGDANGEAFVVYSRAAALANGIADLNAATEIVITRNGTVITELDNIEEIVINTGDGPDTVTTLGSFNPTSLNFNTITINGGTGDDTVDITALQSAHRIVFKSNGGNDTIIGTLRPQDVIELPDGKLLSEYDVSTSGGVTTMTNGTNSITFASSGTPAFTETGTGSSNASDSVVSDTFILTASDLAGLKALVNGQQPPGAGDDEIATGVRTLSGEGNNAANPDRGAVDEPFIRLTQAHYGDPDALGNRAINPIFDGLDPRTISNILGTQEAGLAPNSAGANIFFMAFGQYVDHGLDFLPKGGNGVIEIGGPGTSASSDNPADLTRGTVAGYDGGVPQHNNNTSPFVDQNQAYGSNDLVGQFLRESDGNGGYGAHLLQGSPDPSNPMFNLMPTLRELIQHHWEHNTVFTSSSLPNGQIAFRDAFPDFVDNTTGDVIASTAALQAMTGNFLGTGHALLLDTNPGVNLLDHYIAGDGRANENYALTSIHTIWARNHNFHVENLLTAGFEGSPEELFQAAKILNEAEYQRVVFDEFADTLLGGIRGDGTHGHNGYNPQETAAISHEFAAAAYRFGHSLIGQTMTIADAEGNLHEYSLVDVFLNPTNDPASFTGPLPPGYVPQPGYAQQGVNAIVGGIVQQQAEEVDFNVVDAVRNDLVRLRADLFAFNVARGWDVGLGTLNQVRADLKASANPYVEFAVGEAGNLDPYASWDDFQDRNGLSDTIIEQFKQAYPDLELAAEDIAAFQAINPTIELVNGNTVKGIDRVDLWVGGLAEQHINGGQVGQTFWVILHEQFDRLQEADRFYYTDRLDNFDLYENFVDGQSFSDIIARNTGIQGLDEHVFDTHQLSDDPNYAPTSTNVVLTASSEDADRIITASELLSKAGDKDGDTLSVVDLQLSPGSGGTLVANGNGTWTYKPAANDDTSAAFTFKVSDGTTTSETVTATLDLVPDNDPPGGGGNPVAGVTLNGTNGNNVLSGSGGHDFIRGHGGHDKLVGQGGDDRVYGGNGNDLFIAKNNDGTDFYFGGSGTDTLTLAHVTQNAVVSLNSLTSVVGNVTDKLSSIENVYGGSGDDLLIGNNGRNTLMGRDGNDTLVGGGGNDKLVGGAGLDKFVFKNGFGNDVITDFDANPANGQDKIDIKAMGISALNFDDRVSITDVGADTLIVIDETQKILLKGVGNASSVTESDFVLFTN